MFFSGSRFLEGIKTKVKETKAYIMCFKHIFENIQKTWRKTIQRDKNIKTNDINPLKSISKCLENHPSSNSKHFLQATWNKMPQSLNTYLKKKKKKKKKQGAPEKKKKKKKKKKTTKGPPVNPLTARLPRPLRSRSPRHQSVEPRGRGVLVWFWFLGNKRTLGVLFWGFYYGVLFWDFILEYFGIFWVLFRFWGDLLLVVVFFVFCFCLVFGAWSG